MCGADDRGGAVRAWKDETVQYHQYCADRGKGAACHRTVCVTPGTEWDLVGADLVIRGERDCVCDCVL